VEGNGEFRAGQMSDTLLGPEETGHQPLTLNLVPLRGRVRWRGRGVARGLWCHTGLPLPAPLVGCGVGGVAVCFLRTAQWTRAS
jgi:hypothetical protein